MQIFVDMAKTLAVFCLLEQVILNLLPSGTYRAICEILPGTVAADLIASAGAAVISPDRTIGQQGIYQCV